MNTAQDEILAETVFVKKLRVAPKEPGKVAGNRIASTASSGGALPCVHLEFSPENALPSSRVIWPDLPRATPSVRHTPA
jgi:hypothetical protein